MSEGERQSLALRLYDDWQETDTADSLEVYCYDKGRADEHKNTEMFREIFLENLINQSVDREEAIMYRNICEMSWSKYLEQLKEN